MFGYSEDELMRQTLNSSFRELMEYQVKRAADYYDIADKGIGMLERDSRVAVGLMSRNYRKILNVIKENDFNIFSKRVYVPIYRKLADVPSVVMEFR